MKKKELKIPTDRRIDEYVRSVNDTERYRMDSDAFPKIVECARINTKLGDVRLMVIAVNDLYSTGILNTFAMAKYIFDTIPDLATSVKNGDLKLVDKIRRGHNIRRKKSKKEIDFYSFATKYCSELNQKLFPIFDRYVGISLFAYQQQDNFLRFPEGKKLRKYEWDTKLRIYTEFEKIIREFKSHYKLTRTIREIDHFLWWYGRELES